LLKVRIIDYVPVQGKYSLSHFGGILDAYKTQDQVLRTAFGSDNQSALPIVKCSISGFVYEEVKISVFWFFHAFPRIARQRRNEVTG
jgi:hypothetical protein